MGEKIDLRDPVIYQSCVAGSHITTGAVFQPIVKALSAMVERASENEKPELHRHMWMAMNTVGPSSQLLQDIAMNYAAQHMWQCAWDAGNGSTLKLSDLRRALESDEYNALLSHGLPDDPRGENTERVMKYISLLLGRFEEVSAMEDEVLIASPEEWESFQESCVNAAVGTQGAFFIIPLNNVVNQLRDPDTTTVGPIYMALLNTLGKVTREGAAFAPRRYISGEEIQEFITMAEEYNVEWANASMEWMRGEL